MLIPRSVVGCLAISAMAACLSPELSASVERIGAEYSVLGRQLGDQFLPRVAVNESGGYLVWQDNNSDGDGFGIQATRLNSNLNSVMGSFQVNLSTDGDQQRPAVTLLPDGGAVFAWESAGQIRFRIVNGDGVFAGSEVVASSYEGAGLERNPALATLENGHFALVWASEERDGDMQGIFGQVFDGSGAPVGEELAINETTRYNQRTPSVAALENGRFVVSWVSERISDEPSELVVGAERFTINVFGRIYDENGEPQTGELELGDPELINANPVVSSVDGGFVLVNSGRVNLERITDQVDTTDSWDIYSQSYDSLGRSLGERFKVNTHSYGDQVVPSVSNLNGSAFVAWTSLGQDGDAEGVFGRIVGPGAATPGSEFQVNSITRSRQLLPAVAGNGSSDAVVVWAGFSGGRDSFDLRAQKYSLSSGPPALEAPFVFGAGYWSLGVSWPEPEGLDVVTYEVYLDGSDVPVLVSGNSHTFRGLNAGEKHNVSVAYVLEDGSRSGLSPLGEGGTWSRDENNDGLPDDWQRDHWGPNAIEWPGSNDDSDQDGATNLDELLAGTIPTDPESLLQTDITASGPGMRLEWNTQPGGVYQVQVSMDLNSWFDASAPRLAVGGADSISIGSERGVAVFRVLRLK